MASFNRVCFRALTWTILLHLAIWPAIAQDRTPEDRVQQTLQRAKALVAQGKTADALALGEEAIRLADRVYGKDDPRTASLLCYGVSSLYREMGRSAEAEAWGPRGQTE